MEDMEDAENIGDTDIADGFVVPDDEDGATDTVEGETTSAKERIDLANETLAAHNSTGRTNKLRALPIEYRRLVDGLIEQNLPPSAVAKSVQGLYPKLWTFLDGKMSYQTITDYKKWYESKKKALAIIEDGGEIKTKDLMEAITEMGEQGDVDKYKLLKSVVLLMAHKIKGMSAEYDLDSRSLLPKYISELRQLVELMGKMAGELKADQTSVVVNIVQGHLDGIYKAIHAAILNVCPQFLNALGLEIRKQVRAYQDTIKIDVDQNQNKKQETSQ